MHDKLTCLTNETGASLFTRFRRIPQINFLDKTDSFFIHQGESMTDELEGDGIVVPVEMIERRIYFGAELRGCKFEITNCDLKFGGLNENTNSR